MGKIPTESSIQRNVRVQQQNVAKISAWTAQCLTVTLEEEKEQKITYKNVTVHQLKQHHLYII